MIFVTVGNATQGFRRLLDAVENLSGQGFFSDDQLIIQSGNNPDFFAQYGKQEGFLSMEQFSEMLKAADLVICHGGAGTLIHALQAGKVPVVMPRRMQYGELADDHQFELVKALAYEGRLVPAYEPEDLPHAVSEARRHDLHPKTLLPLGMLNLVSKAIDEFLAHKTGTH